ELTFNEKVEDGMRDLLEVEGELPKVEMVDELTVKITTPTIFGPFLRTVGGVSIYPKHKFEGISGEEFNSAWGQQIAKKNPEDIVGAGPFRLKEYVPEQKVVLERNPYYFRRGPNGVQLPYLDEWVVLKVEDTDAQTLKFKTHETDIYAPVADKIPFLLKNKDEEGWNVKVDKGPRGAPLSSEFIVFNWDAEKESLAKVFQKKQFRRAVSHAIDRQSIADNVFNGLAAPTTSPVGQLSPYYNEKTEEEFPMEYSLEKAQKMLDDLGLEDTNGDGIRELSNGDKLSFTILTNKGNKVREDISNIIMSDLNEIGFDVKFNPVEFNSLVQQLLGGKYQAVVIGLTGSIEPNNGANVWKSGGPLHMWHLEASENPVEWEKRVDELFTKGLKHIGLENRKPYYDEWQAIVAEQVPMIYTVDQIFLYASEKEVQNTETFSTISTAVGHAEFLWKK
ncbi:ABC transporter substrate-binding protein, partial [Candidatus Bipolaricaulota bacterium]|nr:ABC transporter substrate-binding protein [Candidatus Bipolaricaulota bacterium]